MNMKSPRLAPDSHQRIHEVQRHFDGRGRFMYEGLVGRGGFGFAFSVVERMSFGRTRRLAVKRALHSGYDDDLQAEIRWLEILGGAAHIVRVIMAHDDVQTSQDQGSLKGYIRRWLKWLYSSGDDSIFEGLRGPVLVLEYLENSTLKDLWTRADELDEQLPNRLLWAFFLCMIRACVAMAYPPNRGIGAQPRLEIIPDNGAPPWNMEHGDLGGGNVMIGNRSAIGSHNSIPILKLIDFGQAQQGLGGVRRNLFEISKIMMCLIVHEELPYSKHTTGTVYNGIGTLAKEIVPHGNGWKYPTLDEDLRDFLVRCLAIEPEQRPGLEEMLATVEEAVRTKPAESYLNYYLETDEAIHDVLSKLIYDAETPNPGKWKDASSETSGNDAVSGGSQTLFSNFLDSYIS